MWRPGAGWEGICRCIRAALEALSTHSPVGRNVIVCFSDSWRLAKEIDAHHVSEMSSIDDILSPPFRKSASRPQSARGPIIDQDGQEIRDSETSGANAFGSGPGSFEQLRANIGGFDFAHSSANPFGNLTRGQRIARLETLARLLDVAFIVPGTNIRYGIDGIIGLIPIVGDLITTAISLWLVREARALGAPWHLTARMLGNVALDGVVGIIPVVGDAFDVMFRANIRNVRILRKWLDKQPRI